MAKTHQQVVQRLKPAPYTLADLESANTKQQLVFALKTDLCGASNVEFYSTPEVPQNKRGFKYACCRPNPLFESTKYSTSDVRPYSACWSLFDRSNEALVNESRSVVTVRPTHGWRSTRANVGMSHGRWYVEFRIVHKEAGSHVRVGLARREASLEAPVGFDGYAYGVRDIGCEGVHLSKRTGLGYEGDLKPGDVVGLLLDLPPLEEQRALAKGDHNLGCVRDMIPIKYKNELFFEQFEYTSSNEMNHVLNPVTVFGEQAVPDTEKFRPLELPSSELRVFVNGVPLDGKWNNLLAFLPPSSEQREQQNVHKTKPTPDDGDLGYYPMASCYQGGAVELNTTTVPWIQPQGVSHYRPYGTRYTERVVEEYVWDLVDETVNSWLDAKEVQLA